MNIKKILFAIWCGVYALFIGLFSWTKAKELLECQGTQQKQP